MANDMSPLTLILPCMNALVGFILPDAIATQVLVRLELDGNRVAREERYLGELRQRIRDVQEGPDGHLYVVTDEDPGSLLRLRPR